MITEKELFMAKLSGKPVRIVKGETTPEEVELLFAAEIIKVAPGKQYRRCAIALHPIINEKIETGVGYHTPYKTVYVEPGRYMSY